MRECPSLPQEVEPVWDAFWRLSRSRQQGYGSPGGIAPTEVAALLRLSRVDDPEEAELWDFLIAEMDSEYLSHYAEKREQEA